MTCLESLFAPSINDQLELRESDETSSLDICDKEIFENERLCFYIFYADRSWVFQ